MSIRNDIYLRRAFKVLPLSSSDNKASIALVATAARNIENLGFRLSNDLINNLLNADETEFHAWYRNTVGVLKEAVGDNVKHAPMYPNFPRQVMEASEAELFINAVLHYFGDVVGARIMPVYEKELREDLERVEALRVLDLSDFNGMMHFFRSLMSSKSSFSQADKDDLSVLFSKVPGDIAAAIPDEFPNKENLAFITGLVLKHGGSLPISDMYKYFRTATDVLRLAVAMSDGDVSLAENTKFRKFKRSERRMLLELLENAGVIEEDMLRFKSQWKRLGERLHPGEYSQFPKAGTAFAKLRNNLKIETFNSKVEAAIEAGRISGAVDLLVTRPGEFARRLDHLIRSDKATMYVVENFSKVADKVSVPVLLQVRTHFLNKIENPADTKVILPKGNTAKLHAMRVDPTTVPKYVALAVVETCSSALRSIFSAREDLGKVYIDDALRGVAVPMGLRSASKSLDTFGRGTRFKIDEDNGTLRFFIHWKDMEGSGWESRIDLDLSATTFDENFYPKGDLAYYRLRDNYGWHSGDITSAPNGASEFIDIDIKKAQANGVRYVGMVVYNYTRQNLSEVPECFAGFMTRSKPNSGEVYEPSTVVNKVDLSAESVNAMPYIFDLKTGEAIWVDISVNGKGRYQHNVASNKDNLSLALESLVKNAPASLYDLFELHAMSRGILVADRDEADLVFAFDGDVTPRETEKILDLYL